MKNNSSLAAHFAKRNTKNCGGEKRSGESEGGPRRRNFVSLRGKQKFFLIGWFAGVEKKFVVHKFTLLVFNWAKRILKIVRGFEPAFGEPRRARRASVSVLCRASRGWIGRQNSWKFNTGAFVWRNPNLFWTKLTLSPAAARLRSPFRKKSFLLIFWFSSAISFFF